MSYKACNEYTKDCNEKAKAFTPSPDIFGA